MSEKFDAKGVHLPDYEKDYNPESFWDKVKNVAKVAGKPIIKNALLLYYALQSDRVSALDKAMILGALGYFILPADAIPDIIPLLGFTDDAAVLLFVLKKLGDMDESVKAQAEAKLKEWF